MPPVAKMLATGLLFALPPFFTATNFMDGLSHSPRRPPPPPTNCNPKTKKRTTPSLITTTTILRRARRPLTHSLKEHYAHAISTRQTRAAAAACSAGVSMLTRAQSSSIRTRSSHTHSPECAPSTRRPTQKEASIRSPFHPNDDDGSRRRRLALAARKRLSCIVCVCVCVSLVVPAACVCVCELVSSGLLQSATACIAGGRERVRRHSVFGAPVLFLSLAAPDALVVLCVCARHWSAIRRTLSSVLNREEIFYAAGQ